MSKAAEDFISKTLFEENAPVNYRLLSRELKIHVNEAKQYLQQFYTTHSKQVTPSYVLVGKPKDNGSNKVSLSISIVPDEQNNNNNANSGADAKSATSQEVEALLNEAKNKYQTLVSCHIYSLSPSESLWKLSEIISGIESKLEAKFPTDSNKDLWNTWGIIKNPEPIPDFANVPQAAPSLSRPQAPADVAPRLNNNSNNKDAKTPKTEAKEGITSRYVSRKQQQHQQQQKKSDSVISALNKSTSKGPIRSKTSDTPSNVKTEPENGGSIRDIKRSFTEPRSTASSSPVPAKAQSKAATPSYRYVSRKVQKNQPVEKVVISHGGSVKPEEDEEIEDMEAVKQRKVKEEQQRKELESLFDDDEEEEEGGNFGDEDVEMADADADTEAVDDKKNDNGNIEPISISTDTTEANNSKQGIDVSTKSEGDSVQEISQIPEEEQAPEEELQSYVDEDGYLVSKKVSNAAKKSSPPTSTAKTSLVAKPKSRPLPATNEKGKKKQKQSSLLSFFNKK